jgi:hypothetical protein
MVRLGDGCEESLLVIASLLAMLNSQSFEQHADDEVRQAFVPSVDLATKGKGLLLYSPLSIGESSAAVVKSFYPQWAKYISRQYTYSPAMISVGSELLTLDSLRWTTLYAEKVGKVIRDDGEWTDKESSISNLVSFLNPDRVAISEKYRDSVDASVFRNIGYSDGPKRRLNDLVNDLFADRRYKRRAYKSINDAIRIKNTLPPTLIFDCQSASAVSNVEHANPYIVLGGGVGIIMANGTVTNGSELSKNAIMDALYRVDPSLETNEFLHEIVRLLDSGRTEYVSRIGDYVKIASGREVAASGLLTTAFMNKLERYGSLGSNDEYSTPIAMLQFASILNENSSNAMYLAKVMADAYLSRSVTNSRVTNIASMLNILFFSKAERDIFLVDMASLMNSSTVTGL